MQEFTTSIYCDTYHHAIWDTSHSAFLWDGEFQAVAMVIRKETPEEAICIMLSQIEHGGIASVFDWE